MIELVLDECLQEIQAHRATVASCLAQYPELRDELEPLLTLALALEDTPDPGPSLSFKQGMRARLLGLEAPRPNLSSRLKDFLVPRRAS